MKSTTSETIFCIGSMINPKSFAARGLTSLDCKPAELLNHRIVFKGALGMAGVEEVENESFHGVLRVVSETDMKKLDAIETGYDRVTAYAKCYDGSTQTCTVYKFNPDTMKQLHNGHTEGVDGLPQERYLDIIIEGCKHHGVHADHIKW